MKFQAYRLPDGRIVQVDATAAKAALTIGFTLEGGRIVEAVRVGSLMAALRILRDAENA